jgi:MGT family glycosyltransferase
VLISLSTTIEGQREALPPIFEAMTRLSVRGVLTLGGVLPSDEIRAPSNIDVLDYVPHASVLPQVSAVVCHGGLGTVMSALAHGVPLVCIPQGREQPLNAERVQACGAGVMVPRDASASTIAEALRVVIEDPAYRVAAGRVAARIGEAGAGADASLLVEELLQQDRVPV